MAGKARPAPTKLGRAMQKRRAAFPGEAAATELGIESGTYYRLERGAHRPSLDTAVRLARWLGWTVEQVIEAASDPA